MTTSNPRLTKACNNAAIFWNSVLDSNAEIKIEELPDRYFPTDIVAFTRDAVITFNSDFRMSRLDLYYTSVHEIGHVLGLRHSPYQHSVMYLYMTPGPEYLYVEELEMLKQKYRIKVNGPRVRVR